MISRSRAHWSIFALAVGSFGIGTTEFVSMGLLPLVSQDLLAHEWAVDQEAATGQAGLMVSAYALGVVVGAPTLAALLSRFNRVAVLSWIAVAFTVGSLASALAPTFPTLLIARFLAALPHGVYFGFAALVAGKLLGPGKQGQAIALTLLGLTIANIVGVPLATALGQSLGWRSAFVLVAAIFALAAILVRAIVPPMPGTTGTTLRGELAIFQSGAVWLVIAIGSVGFAGFFAVYSYVAPLVTEVAGLGHDAVPWVLATVGVGMTLGILLGGRLTDRSVTRTLLWSFIALAAVLLGYAFVARSWLPAVISLVLVAITSQVVAPAIQMRLLQVSGDRAATAASLNHSALNIGNALGAFLGGSAIAMGLGYASAIWVAFACTVIGIVLVLLSLRSART